MQNREIFEMVEIDLPFCSLTFGVGACTAALSTQFPYKCWNLRKHCAAPTAYTEGTPLTLKFCKDGPIPRDVTGLVFPVLDSVSASDATVNIGGAQSEYGQLGKRASLSFKLSDFVYHERGVDPYVAERISGAAQYSGVGYDPEDRSTFFAKLLSRWPNFSKANVRYVVGYFDASRNLTGTETMHFFLSSLSGPSGGSVSGEALDVLDLTNEKTALCPAPSNGVLLSDIGSGDTSLTIGPTGIGDDEYPASGRACVSSEVMEFTRSGDVLTLTRGARGTTAASHSAGDTVQLVWSCDGARIDDVIAELWTYTPAPASYIDAAAMEAEVDRWGSSLRLTTDICTPTAVGKLLAELPDLGCSIVPDLRAQKLKFQMVRPLDAEDVAIPLSDTRDAPGSPIKSIKVETRDKDRVTQILFCSKRNDPTKSATDLSNYAIRMLTVDPRALSLYGDVQQRTIYTRWLDQGDEVNSAILSWRLIGRFRHAPYRITVKVDAEGDAELVDVVTLATPELGGPDGGQIDKYMQVTGRSSATAYHDVSLILESFPFGDERWGFIAPDTVTNTYDVATDEEKRKYAFIAPDTGVFADGTEAYKVI